jgi:serine/threonine protein kinase
VPTSPSSAPDSPSKLAAQLPERIGPFTVSGVLGRGGMGVVFDAVAPDGRRVALKVIRPYGDPDRAELLIARFLREAKILEQLDHPGVVKLVASGETDGVLFLAMERIEGVSLLTLRRQGSLGFEPLCVFGAQMADALAHMHEAGVVHRDIKPANILIDKSGQPIITDFGISGLSEATGITRQGDLLGSPGFMAPEVIEGKTPTALSDQFSLGRLLYELGATGPAKKLPRGAPILEVLQAALEIDWNRFPTGDRWDELQMILRKMVATQPDARFPTSRLALAAFRALSGADVLDSDTLSEHVTKLPVTTSWEALANDLSVEATEPPPDADPAATIPPLDGERPLRPKFGTATEEEPTQLDLDLAPEVMKPRDLAKILEPASPHPSADLSKLLRQIGALQKDLERARAKRVERPSAGPWIALAFFSLFAGVAAGWFGRMGNDPPPPLVLVPSHGDVLIDPKQSYDEKRGIPSAKQREEAREMLAAASESLAKKDLATAERLLVMCIEIADLPECHKTLGSILALEGDAAARAHFERYVDLAPDAPDAAQIRKLLDN